MQCTFNYGLTRVREMGIKTRTDEESELEFVEGLEVEGELVRPTPRFWSSFFKRFGISESTFRYFDHREVFQRIAERSRNETF